ncbi:MAG: hypothetical protein GEU98_10665 [Pseudonocardiaceae bacterium]|nr:hypothetical protein [Pseudonocardiaceae bacterium]
MQFRVEVVQLTDFGGYLGAEASRTLPYIEQIAREEGMSAHGFAGPLFQPFGDFLKGDPSTLVGDAFTHMQRGLCFIGDAVIQAGTLYDGTENANTSLLEKVSLAKDTGEEVTFGTYDQRYDPHVTQGQSLSVFRVTDLENPNFDRSDPGYYEKANNRAGPSLFVLNEIWANWPGGDGKNFVDSMVTPLAGNSNSIRANGEAWRNVGHNVGLVGQNMTKNVGVLVDQFWQGEAGDAFRQFLDKYFTKTVVWAGDTIGEFIATGFDEFANVVDKAAKEAVDGIDKICSIVDKQALKAVPYIGWIVGVIIEAGDAAIDIINSIPLMPDIPVDLGSLRDAILDIFEIANGIKELYGDIEEAINTMREYVNIVNEFKGTIAEFQSAVEGVLGAVASGNVDNIAAAYRTATEKFDEMQNQMDQINEKVGG